MFDSPQHPTNNTSDKVHTKIQNKAEDAADRAFLEL